jgi:methylisocitrate lyase
MFLFFFKSSLMSYSLSGQQNMLSSNQEQTISKAQMFRNLINGAEIFQLPGVYDCLSAKVCEQVGFKTVYTSGLSVAASHLGLPDIGLLTAAENVAVVSRIVDSVDIPVLMDCDTGYGNSSNVYRLVHDLTKANVAAIQLEDQTWPKKCGHFEGTTVIPCEEHVAKIRAAVAAAHRYGDLVIVARTDARNSLGLDVAIERARKYYEAGASMVFVEAPKSIDELKEIIQRLNGIPVLANFIEGGKTPIESVKQLHDLGFKAVMYSTSGILSSMQALSNVYSHILNQGSTHGHRQHMSSFASLQKLIGLNDTLERQATFEHDANEMCKDTLENIYTQSTNGINKQEEQKITQ